jgi:methyl-accepting chemotaxis protein
MSPRRYNKRSVFNFLINPKFQVKFVLGLTLPGLIVIALYTGVVYSYVHENYETLVELSPMTAEAKAQLYTELNRLLLILGAGSFVFLAVMAALGVVFSHRTAGPLYHFKRVFKDIAEGKIDARIRLRPFDDFRDVADAFNEMAEKRIATSKPGDEQQDRKAA